MNPRYQTPRRIQREAAYQLLTTGTQDERIDAILSLSLYEDDYQQIQERLLELLSDADVDVVATAILGLGHIARRHGDLDLVRTLPALEDLKSNPALRGRVADTLDDIEIYVRRPRER